MNYLPQINWIPTELLGILKTNKFSDKNVLKKSKSAKKEIDKKMSTVIITIAV